MEKRFGFVHAAGVAIGIIWGLTFLSIKVIVVELPPMTLALLRFIMASALMPLLAMVSKTSLRLAWRDLPMAASGGLMGITFYFFFENNGIMRLSASESSLIVGTIPILTLVAEMILYRKKPRLAVTGGILLSFVGVAFIVLKSEAAQSSPEGYLYMVGAALTWVAYSFLTKPLAPRYPLLAITFWQIFFGMLGCIPFALIEGRGFGGLSLPIWLNVAFLGVVASAVGYWLYVVVLDRLGASRSSVFINLIPVVSIVASYFVLGERLAPLQLAGGAAAILGVYLATSR